MLKRNDRPALSASVSAWDDATRTLVAMLWENPENRPYLAEPRRVDFYLWFPEEEPARALGLKLVGEGYLVVVGERPPEWMLRATSRIHVHAETIIGLERRLRALAERAGGEYDAWSVKHPKREGASNSGETTT